jgi:hypothetical protein
VVTKKRRTRVFSFSFACFQAATAAPSIVDPDRRSGKRVPDARAWLRLPVLAQRDTVAGFP